MIDKRIMIILIILVILVVTFVFLSRETEENQMVPETEKEMIEEWILESNLNQYGDSKDTIYTGGTPLFDEKTGESIDRYEYILRNHPDKPWLE